MEGTTFQLKVWKQLTLIPRGETRTYKQIAEAIGHSNSARAVANACAANPYAPDVPCHRVIRSDGTLGGYSAEGGIAAKQRLLDSES
ncbi:MAG: MGMT family protein [Candidatus Thalassarchaeaceae archaeon]|nr:MGMT family protein [Candidatus Thalassarchaeaceae archaeon]